ncbi:MAG: hypothetical protein ACXW2Y_08780 [Acidimicrobiia bacterium]
MSDTIDQQLEHLAELHADGALTDGEFAAAKASTLGSPATAAASGGSPTAELTRDPILDAPRPNIPSKIVWVLLIIAAFAIGVSIMGLSGGFEWAPPQQLAAPIVCPGGELVAGFDVSYTVNTKGVDFASTCVEDGHATPISGLWLNTVMTIEYTLIFLAIFVGWRLLWLRSEARHESVATWSATGVTGTGVNDA